MKTTEFIEAVRAMRNAQRNYFRTPPSKPEEKQNWLRESKGLESKVDRMLTGELLFCSCPTDFRTGETSAIHCNVCGGIDTKETWLMSHEQRRHFESRLSEDDLTQK
jgi:hypothetical protein